MRESQRPIILRVFLILTRRLNGMSSKETGPNAALSGTCRLDDERAIQQGSGGYTVLDVGKWSVMNRKMRAACDMDNVYVEDGWIAIYLI